MKKHVELSLDLGMVLFLSISDMPGYVVDIDPYDTHSLPFCLPFPDI